MGAKAPNCCSKKGGEKRSTTGDEQSKGGTDGIMMQERWIDKCTHGKPGLGCKVGNVMRELNGLDDQF